MNWRCELPLGHGRSLRFESNYVAFVHVCILFAPHGAGLGTLRMHTPPSPPYTTFENTSPVEVVEFYHRMVYAQIHEPKFSVILDVEGCVDPAAPTAPSPARWS